MRCWPISIGKLPLPTKSATSPTSCARPKNTSNKNGHWKKSICICRYCIRRFTATNAPTFLDKSSAATNAIHLPWPSPTMKTICCAWTRPCLKPSKLRCCFRLPERIFWWRWKCHRLMWNFCTPCCPCVPKAICTPCSAYKNKAKTFFTASSPAIWTIPTMLSRSRLASKAW